MEESERPAKKLKGDHLIQDEVAQFVDETDNSEVTLPSSNSHPASQKPNGEMLPPSGIVASSAIDGNAPPPGQTTTETASTVAGSSAPNADPPDEITKSKPSGSTTNNPPEKTEEATSDVPKPLSKSALKKLKRKEEWEAGRETRKALKKEKRKVKRANKREAFEEAQKAAAAENHTNGDSQDPGTTLTKPPPPPKRPKPILLPVTFVFDCDFDKYMMDKEIMSITSQITRCYSDNKGAPFRAHLVVSSFSGRMRERLETVLAGHFKNWQGFKFCDENFLEVAKKARTWMLDDKRNRLAGAFAQEEYMAEVERNKVELQAAVAASEAPGSSNSPPIETEETASPPPQTTSAMDIIYLTSDSPYTLTHLSPYTTYIIGGIVDKNRHKGLCYKKATTHPTHRIRTAKLPIGQYMKMQSRQVLTVNQVSEIMLRWLECGDWGEAFVRVVPKRKGGELRDELKKGGEDVDAEGEEEDGAEDDAEEDVDVNDAHGTRAEGVAGKRSSDGLAQDGEDPGDSEDEEEIEIRV